MYKTTRDILNLSTGFQRPAGKNITEAEVRDHILWQAWLDEGVIVEVADEPQEEVVAAPPVAASIEKKESPAAEHDRQLQDLSDDELREMGKRLKVTSWHRMNRETLIQRIEERS